jgi:peptide/nickel transport system permease protein
VIRRTRESSTKSEESYYVASQWQLIARRFRVHKAARISLTVLCLIYVMGVFCELVAPYGLETRHVNFAYAPPHAPRFLGEGLGLRPYVYGYRLEIDQETLRKTYVLDRSKVYELRFFLHGEPYKMWGLIEWDIHLFGVDEGVVFILGTDRLGRDMLSRILYGSRVSLSIGLVGVFLSLIIGVFLGGVSGYFGGGLDTVIQRAIEMLRSIPTVPLWLGLSAAVPVAWPPLRVYFGITVILSLIGWTGLARVVRGKLLSLREEDFVLAARLSGATGVSIVLRHLVPGFMSYIIVSLTLSIPAMILGETSLSFLGLGLRPPVTSWGVLLKEAQNASTVALYPWLMIPVFLVIATVICFNFVGDGLRDAADPYR